MEPLEIRRLLVAEGALFTLSETVDASGLPGNLRASVIWGDGTTTPAAVEDSRADGKLRFKFDYSLDSRGFFSGANRSRREVLAIAGELLLGQMDDDLAAIVPGGNNQWRPNIRHPSSGNDVNPPIHNLPGTLRVAANEIIVYAGSRDFPGQVRAIGGSGGVSSFSGSQSFLDTVRARGEPGALQQKPTDFAPSVGSISFDSASSTDWYFGLNPEGIQSGQVDFLSVAMHELAHVLGFGTAPSWQSKVSGGRFNGPKAVAAYGGSGNVPLSGAHWDHEIKSQGGHDPLMAGHIETGQRRLLTALDLGALDDIGWDVSRTAVKVQATHRFADNDDYPVQLVLRGIDSGEVVGERSFSDTIVSVTNVAPSLSVPADRSVIVDEALSIIDVGTITDVGFRNQLGDPATVESFTYSIDWGDGSSLDQGTATIDRHGNRAGDPTRASFNGNHVYKSPGVKTVNVRVTDDDGGTRQKAFRITVAEKVALELSLSQPIVNENQGENATMLTIARPEASTESPQTVQLASSDDSEAQVPATVVIPAGETTVRVPVDAVDDALLDGDVDVSLTVTGSGVESGTIDLLVKDRERLIGRFSEPSISEGRDAGIRLIVQRSNTDTNQELEVSIAGGITSQVANPTTITIPKDQRETSVTFFPIDDVDPELPRLLSYRFTAPGYVMGTAGFELRDNEPPAFQNPLDRFDVNGKDGVQASDALRIINELARRNDAQLDPSGEQPSGFYLDVNGDYLVTALDALIVINELPNRQPDGETKMVAPASFLQTDETEKTHFQFDVFPASGSLF